MAVLWARFFKAALQMVDPQGTVALILCESILHVLVEQNVITKQKALEAINTVAELTQESPDGTPIYQAQTAEGLARIIAESFALKD
jgi:hypothetical protein